ncbi:MAG: phosphatase PAP2 family protein [Candidatus Limnocylindrales bacterium]
MTNAPGQPVSTGASHQRVTRPIGRRAVPPGIRFGGAAVGAGVLFWVVYAGFVLTEFGQRVENLGLAGAALRDDLERAETLARLSQISVLSFGAAILVVLLIAALRRRLGLGAVAIATMVGATVIAEVLKDVLPRPPLVTGPTWLLRNTFPSGTAAVAASIAIGAILVAPDRLRAWVVPLAAAFVAIIGQSTQVAGWHRLSGAIGGVLLVETVASVALVVMVARGMVRSSDVAPLHPRIRTGLVLLAGTVLIIGLVVITLPVLFPLLQAPTGSSSVFVHTAFDLFGVGVSFLAVLAFGALVEPFGLGHPRAASRQGDPPPPSLPA